MILGSAAGQNFRQISGLVITVVLIKNMQRDYVFKINFSCRRSVDLVYEKDTSIHGIDVYRYHLSHNLFANVSERPDNVAFCSNNETCWQRGITPLSKCTPGGIRSILPCQPFLSCINNSKTS